MSLHIYPKILLKASVPAGARRDAAQRRQLEHFSDRFLVEEGSFYLNISEFFGKDNLPKGLPLVQVMALWKQCMSAWGYSLLWG